MRARDTHAGQRRAAYTEQAVADPHDRLRDDRRMAVTAQQVVDIRDGSGMRVLHGHHDGVDIRRLERGEDFRERASSDE